MPLSREKYVVSGMVPVPAVGRVYWAWMAMPMVAIMGWGSVSWEADGHKSGAV